MTIHPMNYSHVINNYNIISNLSLLTSSLTNQIDEMSILCCMNGHLDNKIGQQILSSFFVKFWKSFFKSIVLWAEARVVGYIDVFCRCYFFLSIDIYLYLCMCCIASLFSIIFVNKKRKPYKAMHFLTL